MHKAACRGGSPADPSDLAALAAGATTFFLPLSPAPAGLWLAPGLVPTGDLDCTSVASQRHRRIQ